ncbi:hypothetical protein ACR30L_06515 [Psychromonas sp. PT13]|uniref:hypothetical protein n=1 Tax=Psychromonas sp. PT13 TaxID=3439547 RepID=UPI003EB80C16
MKNKPDSPKKTNLKSSPEEVQAWLDSVHFGSCCSDPITTEEHKICEIKDNKQNA